ncbi:MAG: hypothetical protein R3F55_25395 [Alphaproteobacteria bacterium]
MSEDRMTAMDDEARIAALLDGSLDPAVSQRVEAEVARSPRLLQMLGEFALLNCTLRRTVTAPFTGRKPASAFIGGGGSVVRGPWRRALPAMAASVIALAAAAGGFFGGRADGEAALETAYLEVYEAREQTLDRALEASASGEAVAWAKPGTSWTLEITPIRTYRSADERWCREYRSAEEIGSVLEVRLGVACRAGDGHWQTQMEQMVES